MSTVATLRPFSHLRVFSALSDKDPMEGNAVAKDYDEKFEWPTPVCFG